MIKKEVSEYNDIEIVKAFNAVRDYLRGYKEDLIVNGRTVRYIDYYIVRQIGEELFGFQDELVYVGKAYKDDKYIGEHYIGVRDKELNIIEMKYFLEGIDKDKLHEILAVDSANKALNSFNKDK